MSLFFISYQHKSRRFARQLRRRIRDAGLLDWMDEDIQAGEEWKIEIDTAIKQSLAVVVVVTLDALRSPFVTYEWSFALGLGKRVIPVILQMPDPSKLDHPKFHPKLDDRQYRDFTNAKKRPWTLLIEELRAIQQQEDIPPAVRNAENVLLGHARDQRIEGVRTLVDYEHPAATEALARAINSLSPDVSAQAAIGLAEKSNYTDERAIPGPERALYGNARDIYMDVAIGALRKMNSASAVATLLRAFETAPLNEPLDLRGKTTTAMSLINDVSAVSALRKMICTPGIRNLKALDALGDFQDRQALPELVNFVRANQDDYEAITHAINALAKFGDHAALVPLYEALQGHFARHGAGAKQVVDAILGAFADIGGEVALQLLEDARNDKRYGGWQIAIGETADRIRQKLNISGGKE